MNALISTWHERWGEWLTALLQHLQISLVSLLIAIAVAVPLGILLQRRRRAAEIALQITGIVQTIPSLALLGLLIPLVGIGTVPAVIALVAYALFPIMQSTITGLNGIDPNLVEAGTAFGMTRGQRLRKFELPIAMPVIVSGVRTSAVMIIGTATLAALIGAGGPAPSFCSALTATTMRSFSSARSRRHCSHCCSARRSTGSNTGVCVRFSPGSSCSWSHSSDRSHRRCGRRHTSVRRLSWPASSAPNLRF